MNLFLLIFSTFFLLSAQSHDDFMSSQEIAQGIPANLIRAISNVESGKSSGSTITPWPWTINVEGKGYMFKTKAEAIKAVEKFQKKGLTSIDVGIMQVNLHHHPKAFANLHEAFDPQLNIAYAAKFLKQLFLQHRSWHKAICHYHSASPKHYNAYKQKVLKQWTSLCRNVRLHTFNNTHLAQTVIRFDDLESINENIKNVKICPQTSIRTFAKVKKIYYGLDGSKINKISQRKQNSDNHHKKQLYSLD